MKEKELWIAPVQKEVEKKQEDEKNKKAAIILAVKDKLSYTPPKGLFTKSPKTIATRLKADSDSLKQAMSRLNFYINRAGKTLTEERSKALEEAKDILRNLYKKSASVNGRPPKAWWESIKKRIHTKNPSYTDEQIAKTIGNIWHNQLTDYRKKKLLEKYE